METDWSPSAAPEQGKLPPLEGLFHALAHEGRSVLMVSDDEALLDACAHLVPGIERFDVATAQPGLEGTYDLVLNSSFTDREALAAYQAHPYRRPVIGWMPDLEAMQPGDARTWYARWYAPNNAYLVVVGDVDHREVFREAEKHYGSLAADELPARIDAMVQALLPGA